MENKKILTFLFFQLFNPKYWEKMTKKFMKIVEKLDPQTEENKTIRTHYSFKLFNSKYWEKTMKKLTKIVAKVKISQIAGQSVNVDALSKRDLSFLARFQYNIVLLVDTIVALHWAVSTCYINVIFISYHSNNIVILYSCRVNSSKMRIRLRKLWNAPRYNRKDEFSVWKRRS